VFGYKSFTSYVYCKCFIPARDYFYSLNSVLSQSEVLFILIKSNLVVCSCIDHAFDVESKTYQEIKITFFLMYRLKVLQFCVLHLDL
jgi:hypothetical protein